MNKKFIWVIVVLSVLTAVLIGLKVSGVIGKEDGLKVFTEKVTPRTIIETVNASGKVYPEIEVKLSSDVSGEIVELKVEEGDSVYKGQEVARIYADIYATERDQVAANVNQVKAQASNSLAALGSLKASLEQAQSNFNRQKRLLSDKVISQSEFEQAEQSYKVAQANYLAAMEGLKSGEASIAGAQAQLSKANKDLSRTTISAPMNGVISVLSVKKGERVVGTAQMSGTEMMRIADMNSIVAQVDVGENDIPKVKLGDSAVVEIDAYNNRKFKGVVFKIANPTTAATSSSTDVTTYKVHIRLSPASYKDLVGKGSFPFRPGMSASADIQTKTMVNVQSLPLNAITTRSKKISKEKVDKKSPQKSDAVAEKSTDGSTKGSGNSIDEVEEVVFVIDKPTNTIKKVAVTTGIQDINYIQVNGLKDGQEVVAGPYNLVSKTLKEGDKVQIVTKESLFEDNSKKE